MKKHIVPTIAALLGLAALTAAQSQDYGQGEGVTSLRGDHPIDRESQHPTPKRWQRDREPIERDYVSQPPLIPHSVEGYKINLKFNKCLTCHAWTNYKSAGATKTSQTHFEDRDRNIHANVAARRYFCTQCHVSQMDTPPLVENTFQPLPYIKR